MRMKEALLVAILLASTQPSRAETILAADCAKLAEGTHCPSYANCTVSDPDEKDAKAYACWARQEGTSCVDAINSRPSKGGPLSDKDIETIRSFYLGENNSAECSPTAQSVLPVLKGALATSLWTSRGGKGWLGGEYAIQVMPSASLGIPLGIDDTKLSGKAIKGVTAVAGIEVRATPSSYLLSAHAFFGTANPATKDLPSDGSYPNPALVLAGLGLDFGAGAVSLSFVRIALRSDGITSETRDHQWCAQLSFDLTAIGIGIGALKN